VKSHKKIAWKLEVFETFQNIKCEFWYVLNMLTTFHENLVWEDAKNLKLDMPVEQPILCADGEILIKNWNFEHESKSADFHVGSWINMFQSKMICLSWISDENVYMQSRVGESVSWEFDEWKVSKFEKECF
jgi:hypothetical protein